MALKARRSFRRRYGRSGTMLRHSAEPARLADRRGSVRLRQGLPNCSIPCPLCPRPDRRLLTARLRRGLGGDRLRERIAQLFLLALVERGLQHFAAKVLDLL